MLVLLAILVGLLLPSVTNSLRKDEKARAEKATLSLKNAITAYLIEYHEYPLPDPANDLTIDSGNGLMDILLGSDPQKGPGGRNPRGIVFYSDRAARPIDGGRFRKGLTLLPDGTGELWDPWGNHYRVRMDTDGDGRVSNPDPAMPARILTESILVWSAGPDGDFETWKDNAQTW